MLDALIAFSPIVAFLILLMVCDKLSGGPDINNE